MIALLAGLKSVKEGVCFLAESTYWLITGRFSLKTVYQQAAIIGFDGLPVALVIATIAGAVLAIQTAEKFAQTGAESYVGGLVAIAIVREIAPVFTCLSVAAESGTALAAELAHMAVTDQLDALRVLRVSPTRYLMSVRVLACILSLPMMTVLCSVVGVLGAMLVVRQTTHLHYSKFIDSVWLLLRPHDIFGALIKAVVFGLLMGTVCCTIGLRAKGGAEAVGRSATLAAVSSALIIMVSDFLLTWLLFAQDSTQQVLR